MLPEEWRPVLDWEELYEVSSLGNVRSLDRTVVRSDGRVRQYNGQHLAPADNGRGYLYVHMTSAGRRSVRVIHQLVAEAFLGHRRNGYVQLVRHRSGNKYDNSVANLQVGTQSENMLDKRRHGTDPNASRPACIRGHLLIGNNLWARSGVTDVPNRACRACSNAQSWMRYHGTDPGRMQEIADSYYRQHMAVAA